MAKETTSARSTAPSSCATASSRLQRRRRRLQTPGTAAALSTARHARSWCPRRRRALAPRMRLQATALMATLPRTSTWRRTGTSSTLTATRTTRATARGSLCLS
eukprot:361921-Chlamydomonas_euryale.AAC.4